MFNYEPLTKEEASKERYQLLSDGEYDACVSDVGIKISATGNNMLVLNLDVYDNFGKSHRIFDYLVFSKAMMWKVIDFAESAGVLEDYKNKNFNPDTLRGLTVKVIIGTKFGDEIPTERLNGKPIGSKYPDKNVVVGYIPKDNAQEKKEEFIDSDLPF